MNFLAIAFVLLAAVMLLVQGAMKPDDWCKGGDGTKTDKYYPGGKLRPHLHCFGSGVTIDSTTLLDGNNNGKYCSSILAFEKSYSTAKAGTNEATLYPVLTAMAKYYDCSKLPRSYVLHEQKLFLYLILSLSGAQIDEGHTDSEGDSDSDL